MTTRASLPPISLCMLLAHGCAPDESTISSIGAATTHDTSSHSSDSETTSASTTLREDTTSGDATADASTADATTDPSPACGDGLVEQGEECDDGDLIPDNGCSDTCTADIRAFVSSTTYKAGELMSITLADALCFNHALNADLIDPLRFKAFLSDSDTDARDRFKGRGRIVLMNGIVFADSWSTLLAGELHGPLEVTEKIETYHGKIWTGTRPDGTAVPDSTHCADWSTNSALEAAYYGYSDEVSGEWLLADQLDNPADCPAPLAIYCFETS
jgi:cysteine-rich repeat protein